MYLYRALSLRRVIYGYSCTDIPYRISMSSVFDRGLTAGSAERVNRKKLETSSAQGQRRSRFCSGTVVVLSGYRHTRYRIGFWYCFETCILSMHLRGNHRGREPGHRISLCGSVPPGSPWSPSIILAKNQSLTSHHADSLAHDASILLVVVP